MKSKGIITPANTRGGGKGVGGIRTGQYDCKGQQKTSAVMAMFYVLARYKWKDVQFILFFILYTHIFSPLWIHDTFTIF